MRIGTTQIENLPMKIPSENQQNEIVDLVNKILELNKELTKTKEHSERNKRIREEISRVDNEIDNRIYELYGLTKDEIAIIADEHRA